MVGEGPRRKEEARCIQAGGRRGPRKVEARCRQVVGEGPKRKEEARCRQAGGRRGAKEEGGGQVQAGMW